MIKNQIYVSVFGWMFKEMQSVGLVHSNGNPIKQKLTAEEEDGMAIYNHVRDHIMKIDSYDFKRMITHNDNVVKRLINDDKTVVNYLLALYLFEVYLTTYGSFIEQNMILPKVYRQIGYMQTSTNTDEKVSRTSHRCADNIFRQFIGKPQLSDDVRDAKFAKLFRR